MRAELRAWLDSYGLVHLVRVFTAQQQLSIEDVGFMSTEACQALVDDMHKQAVESDCDLAQRCLQDLRALGVWLRSLHMEPHVLAVLVELGYDKLNVLITQTDDEIEQMAAKLRDSHMLDESVVAVLVGSARERRRKRSVLSGSFSRSSPLLVQRSPAGPTGPAAARSPSRPRAQSRVAPPSPSSRMVTRYDRSSSLDNFALPAAAARAVPSSSDSPAPVPVPRAPTRSGGNGGSKSLPSAPRAIAHKTSPRRHRSTGGAPSTAGGSPSKSRTARRRNMSGGASTGAVTSSSSSSSVSSTSPRRRKLSSGGSWTALDSKRRSLSGGSSINNIIAPTGILRDTLMSVVDARTQYAKWRALVAPTPSHELVLDATGWKSLRDVSEASDDDVADVLASLAGVMDAAQHTRITRDLEQLRAMALWLEMLDLPNYVCELTGDDVGEVDFLSVMTEEEAAAMTGLLHAHGGALGSDENSVAVILESVSATSEGSDGALGYTPRRNTSYDDEPAVDEVLGAWLERQRLESRYEVLVGNGYSLNTLAMMGARAVNVFKERCCVGMDEADERRMVTAIAELRKLAEWMGSLGLPNFVEALVDEGFDTLRSVLSLSAAELEHLLVVCDRPRTPGESQSAARQAAGGHGRMSATMSTSAATAPIATTSTTARKRASAMLASPPRSPQRSPSSRALSGSMGKLSLSGDLPPTDELAPMRSEELDVPVASVAEEGGVAEDGSPANSLASGTSATSLAEVASSGTASPTASSASSAASAPPSRRTSAMRKWLTSYGLNQYHSVLVGNGYGSLAFVSTLNDVEYDIMSELLQEQVDAADQHQLLRILDRVRGVYQWFASLHAPNYVELMCEENCDSMGEVYALKGTDLDTLLHKLESKGVPEEITIVMRESIAQQQSLTRSRARAPSWFDRSTLAMSELTLLVENWRSRSLEREREFTQWMTKKGIAMFRDFLLEEAHVFDLKQVQEKSADELRDMLRTVKRKGKMFFSPDDLYKLCTALQEANTSQGDKLDAPIRNEEAAHRFARWLQAVDCSQFAHFFRTIGLDDLRKIEIVDPTKLHELVHSIKKRGMKFFTSSALDMLCKRIVIHNRFKMRMMQHESVPARARKTWFFYRAVRYGLVEDVKHMLDCDAEACNMQFYDHSYPLHNAVVVSNAVIIEMLVGGGADVHLKDGNGETPFFVAAKLNSLFIAQYLARHSAQLDDPNNANWSPVHVCAMKGNEKTLRFLIRSGKANINRHGGTGALAGFTALHCAAESFQPRCLDVLLKAGADVGACDQHKRTALHIACMYYNIAGYELLRAAGGSELVKDDSGRTAQDYWDAQQSHLGAFKKKKSLFRFLRPRRNRRSRSKEDK